MLTTRDRKLLLQNSKNFTKALIIEVEGCVVSVVVTTYKWKCLFLGQSFYAMNVFKKIYKNKSLVKTSLIYIEEVMHKIIACPKFFPRQTGSSIPASNTRYLFHTCYRSLNITSPCFSSQWFMYYWFELSNLKKKSSSFLKYALRWCIAG